MKSLLIFVIVAVSLSAMASLPPLKVKGMRLVDPSGKVVTLKGVNVGNWLMIEFWMLGLSDIPGMPSDQFELEKLLEERFGEAEKDRLLDLYRSNWITGADFKNMRGFGFNVVRLPMNYRLMEDDREPFKLKKNAWKWIDAAVGLAEMNGLYTILDMHGAQGGQSPYDHTGHSEQNHLKDDPVAQKRLAWLWGEIAKRYRNRSAVMAYDVFNEPYGTPKDIQVKVFKLALAEIRKNDPEKLVFAMGNYDDFIHYGDPKANGWHNVGFQMHFYPGLFGGGAPTIKTHIAHLNSLKGWAEKVKKYNVPFLIGEMNVVFQSAGGARMMQRYFETHAKYGWMTTMWSWKVLTREGGLSGGSWGCVTNKNPARVIDFHKASMAEIESYLKSFSHDPVAIYTDLRDALSGKAGPAPALPKTPPARTKAPQEELAGWQQADIGSSLKGGLQKLGNGRFALFGGGEDIWAGKDQNRFLYKETQGDFELSVDIHSMEDLMVYSKSGLMVRSSLEPDAPSVILTAFASGEVQLAFRPSKGADMQGVPMAKGRYPNLKLKLVRAGGKWVGYLGSGTEWTKVGEIEDPLPQKVFAGVLALSHDNSQLIQIIYRNLLLGLPK
jgi:endoglucanase